MPAGAVRTEFRPNEPRAWGRLAQEARYNISSSFMHIYMCIQIDVVMHSSI